MQVSLNWLKDFVSVPAKYTPQELQNLLTLKTAEVDSVHQQGKGLEGVVIGELKEIQKHPNADKLNTAKVDIGKKELLSLIFGSMVKMKVGDRVPVAVAPTILPTGMEIVARDMRGVKSEGMLCLDQELGFKEEGVSIQYFPKTKPGTPLIEALGLNDVIFEFDNKALTHRPDLWGHYGIAREIAAITGGKFKELIPKVKMPEKGEMVKVEIKDYELCPRYCGIIIENIKVEESPKWLQERLTATGHGNHNNIVDVTNYVMTELGQPMHAFDKSFIKGGIVVRTAKKGEKMRTLDDKERILDETILVIADHEKPVAIAGVMGGENSEINENTTAIILESANFNSASIRRTSVKLGLRTDAVQRFEKALDPHMAELAIKRAAEIILQICPSARIAGPITDAKKFDEKKKVVEMSVLKTASKIGEKISKKQIKDILESLTFEVKEAGKDTLLVTVPTFRATKDIKIEDDLVEEVARIFGYDNILPVLPELPAKLPVENTERCKKHRARELFSYGLGFDEVYNYSFYGEDDIKKCLIKESGHIHPLNYLSSEQTHLRVSLMPGLMKNLQENVKNFKEMKIYEVGRTYKDIGEYFPLEEKNIVGLILTENKKQEPFYEAKGVVETFMERFMVRGARMAKGGDDLPYAHPVKVASYVAGSGQTVAKVFALHPQVLKNYGLEKFSVAAFEINFTEVAKEACGEKRYKQIPKFPGTSFDVAVLIDKNVEVGKVQTAILKAERGLICGVELFDIYEGQNIESGKKSLAFSVKLQAQDHTLADQEIEKAQKAVFAALEKLGGKVRS